MSMSGTDTALTVGQPVATLYDGNAAITGYILRNGSDFQKVDANLANPTTLFTLAPSAFRSFGVSFGATAPGVWLFVNGGQLYAYSLATQSNAPTVVATRQAGEQIGRILSDGASGYVSITSTSFVSPTFRILRVADTLAVTTVSTGAGQLGDLALTPSRIVTVATTIGSTISTQVASVLRNGSGFVDIGGAGNAYLTLLAYAAGENVYLYEYLLDGNGQVSGVRTRIMASEGSNAQTLANTAVAGVLQAPSVPLVRTLSFSPYAVLLVDNVPTDGTYSGGTLRSVVGSTRASLLTYGTLPATPPAAFYAAALDPLLYGLSGLFASTATGANAGTSDLYFVDSSTPNSLTKLTGFLASSTSSAAAVVRAPGRRQAASSTMQTIRQRLAAQASAASR